MRIFIAGATGVIGRRIVPVLVSQGHSVTGIGRTSERRAELERMLGGAEFLAALR